MTSLSIKIKNTNLNKYINDKHNFALTKHNITKRGKFMPVSHKN